MILESILYYKHNINGYVAHLFGVDSNIHKSLRTMSIIIPDGFLCRLDIPFNGRGNYFVTENMAKLIVCNDTKEDELRKEHFETLKWIEEYLLPRTFTWRYIRFPPDFHYSLQIIFKVNPIRYIIDKTLRKRLKDEFKRKRGKRRLCEKEYEILKRIKNF
jgi:hypothetical protein